MASQGKQFVWLICILVLGPASASVRAQSLPSEQDSSARLLLIDGSRASWSQAHADSSEAGIEQTLAELRREGYYFAGLDSVVRDGLMDAFFVSRGPHFVLGEIEIEGAIAFSEDDLMALMHLRRGQPLDPIVLEDDLNALLVHYERAGYPLAAIEVSGVDLLDERSERLRLALRVAEGPTTVLREVRVHGSSRAQPQYVARLAGLRTGRTMRDYRPDDLRDRLMETGLFSDVFEPTLTIDADTGAVIDFELRDNPPGSFDLAIGFLPPPASGGRMSVVGNGHLALNNLFGRGRTAALKLNRLPGQVSSLSVDLSDPFIFGTPLSVSLSFHGLQEDSTFSKHRFAGEFGMYIARGLLGFVTLGREVTEPGAAGAFTGGAGVRAGAAWFAGVGLRATRVDNRLNPRRGYVGEVAVESGRKSVSGALQPSGDGVTAGLASVEQERIRASFRVYRPIRSRQVLVAGGDAAAVVSATYDESDLIRFGGATTLRGYDEDRFRARTSGRALLEYRLLLDRESYAFAFTDLGYVDAPELPGVASFRGLYPGYGLGIRVGTNVGLVTATYALSPEAGPMNGRVHVGLSFGL